MRRGDSSSLEEGVQGGGSDLGLRERREGKSSLGLGEGGLSQLSKGSSAPGEAERGEAHAAQLRMTTQIDQATNGSNLKSTYPDPGGTWIHYPSPRHVLPWSRPSPRHPYWSEASSRTFARLGATSMESPENYSLSKRYSNY
jgi:hypothetical protein